MKMTELLVATVFFVLLALIPCYRVAKGPSSADRMLAADACDDLLCCAMMLFSMQSGRGIFLDIALLGALFGVIDTMLVGRYLEGRL